MASLLIVADSPLLLLNVDMNCRGRVCVPSLNGTSKIAYPTGDEQTWVLKS